MTKRIGATVGFTTNRVPGIGLDLTDKTGVVVQDPQLEESGHLTEFSAVHVAELDYPGNLHIKDCFLTDDRSQPARS